MWPLRVHFLGWSWSTADGLIVQRINEHKTPLMVNAGAGGEEVGQCLPGSSGPWGELCDGCDVRWSFSISDGRVRSAYQRVVWW